MTKDEALKLMEQADRKTYKELVDEGFAIIIELIRADEREKVMAEPLTKAMWEKYEADIRADEREACAKVCESRATPGTGSVAILNGAADAIRARGNT